MNDEFALKTDTSEDLEITLSDMQPTADGSSIQPANSEEWAMSPPALSQPQAETAEDWGMTSPLTPPPDTPDQPTGWQLPAPVFRCSEGYTPKKFSEPVQPPPKIDNSPDLFSLPAPEIPSSPATFEAAPAPTAAPVAPPIDLAEPSAVPVAAADVEPQPRISEAFAKPIIAAPAAKAVKPPNKILRIVGVIAALLTMLAVVIGFLILIYYLFFHKTIVQ